MGSAKFLRPYWKSLKTRFKVLLILVSFLAAMITVLGFTATCIEWFQGDWKRSEIYIWLFKKHRDVVPLMVIHIGLALLILRRCRTTLKRRKKLSFATYFLWGCGWQIVLSLPAGIWQALNGWSYIPVDKAPLWSRILTPLTNWPFNTGGFTVRLVFDSTLTSWKWLVGQRLGDLLGSMPYYGLLVAVQASILAFIFAFRYKKRKTLADWLPISLGILFLISSFVSVNWFWRGT